MVGIEEGIEIKCPVDKVFAILLLRRTGPSGKGQRTKQNKNLKDCEYWYGVQRENPHDGTDMEMDGKADEIRAMQGRGKVINLGHHH